MPVPRGDQAGGTEKLLTKAEDAKEGREKDVHRHSLNFYFCFVNNIKATSGPALPWDDCGGIRVPAAPPRLLWLLAAGHLGNSPWKQPHHSLILLLQFCQGRKDLPVTPRKELTSG